MSIVAIITSPRKNSNSGAIVNAIAEGAKKKGKDVKFFDINSIADKKGCQACMGCKKAGHCVVKDGLTPVIDAVREADGIILSTPVYFDNACGQYRLVEDRFYSFLNMDFSLNIKPGKKVAIVTTSGSEQCIGVADKIEKTMIGGFKCESVGKIAVPGANMPGFVSDKADILAKAREIGAKF